MLPWVPVPRMVLNPHDSLVTLFPGHQFSDHRTVLRINIRLVYIGAGACNGSCVVFVAAIVLLLLVFRARLDVGQGDIVTVATILVVIVVVRPYLALSGGVTLQHRVVKGHATLRCMTLALILIVVDAVDIDDPLVIVVRVRIVDLNKTRVGTCLNLLLAV